MSEAVDYFSNHRLKLRFPWRLYHGPIVKALTQAVRESPGPDVLNVGAGPFFELRELAVPERRYTVCDIDARAVAMARQVHGPRLAAADVVAAGDPLPYPDGRFDLAVSMDVIEHVTTPGPWLRELVRVVRPGGAVFLTTPNYASRSLRILEATALEAIARVQGFSRKALHPTKLVPEDVSQLFSSVGLHRAQVQTIALGWVISARAFRPDARD